MRSIFLFSPLFLSYVFCHANVVVVGPSDFRSQLDLLVAGDTMYLQPGNYIRSLRLVDLSGTANKPILIAAQNPSAKPVFLGNACCNTVSLTRCEFIHLRDLICDGQDIAGIDALKAEGSSNNWTHDIEIEGFNMINYGASQQNVGISTKCPSWNWHVHHNIIEAAGTGFYFGNSDGEEPFVNGLIEYNLIINTVGYNGQVKHQNVATRDLSLGMPAESKTVIRYNVFSKAQNASSGGNARPNLLVGNFPASGVGADDHFEVYGNFLFQNPTEGLFQGTGNVAFYDNLAFNSAGGWGVTIQSHNGFAPRKIDLFSNTILVSDGWGISISGVNSSYDQTVAGNAVFASTPILGGQASSNVTDVFTSASTYLRAPSLALPFMDLSSENSTLLLSGFSLTTFQSYEHYNRDFDGKIHDASFAGAYTTTAPPTWPLQMNIRDVIDLSSTTAEVTLSNSEITLYPCPAGDYLTIEGNLDLYDILILYSNGAVYDTISNQTASTTIDIGGLPDGLFFIQIKRKNNSNLFLQKILKTQ